MLATIEDRDKAVVDAVTAGVANDVDMVNVSEPQIGSPTVHLHYFLSQWAVVAALHPASRSFCFVLTNIDKLTPLISTESLYRLLAMGGQFSLNPNLVLSMHTLLLIQLYPTKYIPGIFSSFFDDSNK